MEGQTQEHPGRRQQFGIKGNLPKSSVRDQFSLQSQEEKQKGKEADSSMNTQAKAMSDRDHTRVARLAYELYEQRGRKDGHDLDDWFKAERRIMSQGA
jgi:hypothetical protein